MTYAFYVVELCEKIGYQFAFLMFVCLGSVLAFLPIVALMWKGEEWREQLGTPKRVSALDWEGESSRVDQRVVDKLGEEKGEHI